jgi:hypothetical protein
LKIGDVTNVDDAEADPRRPGIPVSSRSTISI